MIGRGEVMDGEGDKQETEGMPCRCRSFPSCSRDWKCYMKSVSVKIIYQGLETSKKILTT